MGAEGYAVNRRFLEESFDELDPVVALRMRQGAELSAIDFLEAFEAWRRLRDSFEARVADIDAWAAGDRQSLRGEQALEDGSLLELLVEKD